MPATIAKSEFEELLRLVTLDFEANLARKRAEEARKAASKEDPNKDGGIPEVTVTEIPAKNEESLESVISEWNTEGGDTTTAATTTESSDAVTVVKKTEKKRAPRGREHVDPGLLTTWYNLDENAVPPVYRLQRIR